MVEIWKIVSPVRNRIEFLISIQNTKSHFGCNIRKFSIEYSASIKYSGSGCESSNLIPNGEFESQRGSFYFREPPLSLIENRQ